MNSSIAKFDLSTWIDRVDELKNNGVVGACFYTDGGMRKVKNVNQSGYGIHAYFYNEERVDGLGGFKLDYPTASGYVEKKKCKKEDAVNVYKFLSAYGNINDVTNQVAEIEAFIQAGLIFLESKMYEFIKTFVIRSDSNYVVEGINNHMSYWKKNSWRKSDGKQVKNLTYWQTVSSIIDKLQELGVVVDIRHVYGHAFDTGNNNADSLATMGLYQDLPYRDDWIDRNDFNAASVEFNPLLIDCKLLYYPSRTVKSKLDGKYYHYTYSNISAQSKVNEVGRNLVDAGIGVIITDSKDDGIFKLYEGCKALDNALNTTPKVLDLNVVTKPSIHREMDEDLIIHLPLDVGKKDIKVMTTSDKVAVVVLDPPRNSLETLTTCDRLLDAYRRLESGDDKDFLSVDITDLLFDKEVNGKGVVKYKFKIMEAISVIAELPFYKESGIKNIKVPLTFGLDLPRRRVFSNIKHLNPKVYAFTWNENDVISYFGTIVKTDNGVGVWCAEHSNTVITEELSDEFYKKED